MDEGVVVLTGGRLGVVADLLDDLPGSWPGIVSALSADTRVSSRHLAFVRLTRPLGLLDGTALLAVPDDFTKEVLEQRVRGPVVDAIAASLGRPVRLAVTVDPTLDDTGDAGDTAGAQTGAGGDVRAGGSPATSGGDDEDDEGAGTPPEDEDQLLAPGEDGALFGVSHPPRPPRPRRDRDARRESEPARLNPKYTFDTFVIGSSNRFAHAAAVAVAEAPARAYNPLFVYGDSGLGKTHLLHAIGHYAMSLYAGVRVRYVNSEEFTNDFINSIRDDKASSFHRRYRDVDVLLVDDVQFLSNKVQTQEEFFHTFNALHESGKQIAIASDRAPKDFIRKDSADIEDRLRSRFEWGLVADIQPPDLETKVAILQKKAEGEDRPLPSEVALFIASNVRTNVRELEGALTRLFAWCKLHGVEMSLTTAQLCLKQFIDTQVRKITIEAIQRAVAEQFGMRVTELKQKNNSRAVVVPRQIAMYLAKQMTEASLPEIGRQFGNKHHTTVMHSIAKIDEQRRADKDLNRMLTALQEELSS